MKLVPCFILAKKGYFLVDSGLLLELVAFLLSFQHSQAVFKSDKKAEFPESLVSDSKGQVSRSRTRLGLGLGFEIQGCSRITLSLGLVIAFCAVC